ncbi:patched domain-containing protein 3-like isoform X3 [Mya arenaria]|nr:patched domain-containing protein 3-like isoform X3 [Mya arenaria]XP_052816275.1 patched domain-containing protein 3-like isoform X3 [Mya arenaria]XP_052816276.1 patched domain-containing protein 3-like isoform X3 [Mya arenaria]
MDKKEETGNCVCHEKVENAIGEAFHRYGRLIFRHPVKIIVMILILNGALGAGMIKLKEDIDVSRVYTPMNSQATKDEEFIIALFPDQSGTEFYSYQTVNQPRYATVYVRAVDGNVVSQSNFYKLKTIVDIVNGTVGEVPFDQTCARRSGACVIDGAVLLTSHFSAFAAANNVSYPYFNDENGIPTDIAPLLGEANVRDKILQEAKYLKLQFYLRSESSYDIEKIQAWQDKFIENMENFRSSDLEIAYAHTDSLGNELNANIGGDIALFSATFTLMITYACVATFAASNDCVANRMMLGFAGVIAAGLGIVASFGLVSASGMSFVSIVGNSPFLILGIGVDDMFILLSGLVTAGFSDSSEQRFGTMMRHSGVAITITSLTNIIAFGCGASSSFKSVRNFCVYTGVAVIFCYINQASFFSAWIALNEKRIEQRKHVVLCCNSAMSKTQYKQKRASKMTIFCCAGQKPSEEKDIDSFLERFPKWVLPKIVKPLAMKIIILFAFAAYLGVAIWGVINLKQGLVISDLVSKESYFYKFNKWEEDYFSEHIPIMFVVDNKVTYSSAEVQNEIQNLLNAASSSEFMTNTTISWLDAYTSSIFYNDTNEASFIVGINSFLADPIYSRFEHDIKISKDNQTIVASRFYVFTITIADSQDSGKMMTDMRKIANDEKKLSVTAFSPSFIFYEQYVQILPQTLQTLGMSLGAVFLVTLFFMPHPLLLFYILVTIVMIITGIVGFMHHWGLTLSSITMIHLIMSVGIFY